MSVRWAINDFHIHILILELLLCRKLPRRNGFWLRVLPLSAVYLYFPRLIPGSLFLSPYLNIGWFNFSFLIMLLLSAALIWLSFKMSWQYLVFCCCTAHTLQHIVHCGARIPGLILGEEAAQIAELFLISTAALVAFYFLEKPPETGEPSPENNLQILLFAVVSTAVVYFVSYWTTSVEGETIGEQFFDLFSCILMLIVLFDGFRVRRAERDQLIMLRLLRQEQEQNRLSKETVEIINRKCHDLRHQISALRHMSTAEQAKSIADLENAVLIYDHFTKSGNADLDLILAEKNLLAERYQIGLQCIADGEKIGFLQTEDIYSLFGNALDNAIETTSQEPVRENRIITLNLFAKDRFLYLHIANPCRRQPVFIDGLPQTTKEDVDYHGFGVRSMRFIAEKYGGALMTGWEDGIFSLDVILPVP